MRRGQIWTRGGGDGAEDDHLEAVILMAADLFYAAELPVTWALPVTNRRPTTLQPPLVLPLKASLTGLSIDTWARIGGITAVPVAHLGSQIGLLSSPGQALVDDTLAQLLGLRPTDSVRTAKPRANSRRGT